MIFVSPQPVVWHHIYQRLKSHWENQMKEGTPPPMVLVLSGWTMSSDFEKQDRWKMTLRWAEQNNCLHLVPDLKEVEKYYVDEHSSYTPFYHEMKHHPEAYKPTREEIQHALEELANKWMELLDKEFSMKTKPVSFSGDKYRSLLVSYQSGYLPPWGSWTNHLANGKPSRFTELRSKVNELIKPLAVDHIMFKEEK
jgi:hypothetical protein